MSYDAGDFRSADFAALNPSRRVPVIFEEGTTAEECSLCESAAMLGCLGDIAPTPPLLDAYPRRRAIQRRIVREADGYFAPELELLVEAVLLAPADRRDPPRIAAAAGAGMRKELAL